jgi:hypothetical protein
MDTRERRSAAWLLLACGTIWLLLVVAALPAWVQAQSNDLPPRPPTATPTAMPPAIENPETKPKPAQPAGAWIELHCQFPARSLSVHSSELWTAVQWRDSGGRWQDVEGWCGSLDEVMGGVGKKVWWVVEKDFGTGPFRWVVRHGYGGELLAGSESFHLPNADGQIVRVGVVLTP